MARLTLAIGAATALLCASINTTAAQESAAGTPVTHCPDAGPGFIRLLDFSTCIRLGLDVTAAFADDVAKNDVHANTMRNADGSPAVAYGTESRTGNKHRLGGYALLRPHLSMVTPTEYGPLWIHVRPSNTSVADVSPAEVGPVFVDDAWASMGAFTLGRRFSFFDYNPGFNHKPGYTSYRTTNVFAVTSPVTDGLSATLALEDGSYRRRDDEVWALYRKERLPDLVAAVHLNQAWGNAHAAVAAHGLTREEALGCSCPDGTRELGFAGSVGAEYRQTFGTTHGRIMVSGAVAEGALDYLGIPHFASDYIADASGAIRKTKGFSAIASYEHVWLPNLRTSFSFSVYGTTSAANDLQWRAKGQLGQVTIEVMPLPNLILGAELNHFVDAVKVADTASPGPLAQATIDQFLLYIRRFF
ncbi:MAG TPA: porin [Beijerinckiaceae bacterium]|nr:porin [Beijerinckiaceae bacterium]